MIKQVSAIAMVGVLSACSALPSFYDDNTSAAAVDLVVSIERLDCDYKELTRTDVEIIQYNTNWLSTYTRIKKSKDINDMVAKFQGTIDEMANKQDISPGYCKLKKKTMLNQATTITQAVMARY